MIAYMTVGIEQLLSIMCHRICSIKIKTQRFGDMISVRPREKEYGKRLVSWPVPIGPSLFSSCHHLLRISLLIFF